MTGAQSDKRFETRKRRKNQVRKGLLAILSLGLILIGVGDDDVVWDLKKYLSTVNRMDLRDHNRR